MGPSSKYVEDISRTLQGPSPQEGIPSPAPGEVVQLTENATVLELLFQSAYPQRKPYLGNIEFETLLQFAEAAEKYELYSAMHSGRLHLREAHKSRPLEVFNYAIQFDYLDIADVAAPHTIAHPPMTVAEVLSPFALKYWLMYYARWENVFSVFAKCIADQRIPGLCTNQDAGSSCESCEGLIGSFLGTFSGPQSIAMNPDFEQWYTYITRKMMPPAGYPSVSKRPKLYKKCESCKAMITKTFREVMTSIISAEVPLFSSLVKPK
ncbi:hypothetical protein HGRIS_000376 [Hohenbuehelia grisea]|uniref:BTB domain-containing protein n=1 Tax=Hohenbuehelia grisea TaxID=104357 RepID=A0ABR3JS94_9AGAR